MKEWILTVLKISAFLMVAWTSIAAVSVDHRDHNSELQF